MFPDLGYEVIILNTKIKLNFLKNSNILFVMSKRYSGKSFKDSNVKKKPKFSFKEKRKLKREKQKKTN